MRGFIITMLSVGLILLLVTLALSFRNAQLSTERALLEPLPLIYASTLVDDIAFELNSIVGPDITINEANSSMEIGIKDTLHGVNHSAQISSYKSFISDEVASMAASNITLNLTNMSNGMVAVFINGDYEYSNNHTSNESVFTRKGGTGATLYEINLTTTAVRANTTDMEFDTGGTLNVTIRYTDLNGTVIEEGAVFPNHAHLLRVEYASGSSLEVEVGPQSGNDGSLRIQSKGISTEVSWAAVLPPINETMKMGYEYDATIEYVQGKAAKRCRIGK